MIRLVRATDADRARVLAWRNSPDGIATSGSQRPVSEDEHRRWWSKFVIPAPVVGHMLATGFIGQTRPNPTSLIWMVHPVQIDPPFLKPSESIGMVRLDGDKGSKEVSIFIEREWRGRGLGLSALSWAIKDEPHVEAIVRKDNAASQKLFRRAGFVPEIETPTVTIFAWRRAADA